jgi:hypothetical protein
MAGAIRIEEATERFDGLSEAVDRLVRQLSRSSLYQRLGFVRRETDVYRLEESE